MISNANGKHPIVLIPLFLVFVFFSHQQAPAQDKQPTTDQHDSSDHSDSESIIGRHVPNFQLTDQRGELFSLKDYKSTKFVVAVFMGTECPIANAYVPQLLEIKKRFADQGVQLFGINSNLADSATTIAAHSQEYKIEFPVLVDANQTVANLFDASRTPEVFVLDHDRKIRYRGRIDDRFGYLHKREDARTSDLESALKELIAGKQVSVPETEPVGCLITRKQTETTQGKITYAKHVSRIFQNKCATCHHADTAAPFSLTSYEEAKDWSEMIKETVVQRRMPPWNADPRFGHFSNDLRLTDKEVDTLASWIDDGAPLGDKNDLPEPKEYATGWTIGKPDVVFKMPREYTVKASGTVVYKYFVAKTNFKEDMWVQAAEARPGNRKAVHHIIVFYRPANSKKVRRLPSIVGTAPGEEPQIFPIGMGKKIPAGSELVFQVHYTPTGKIEKDISEVGLIFCKQPPKRIVRGNMAINLRFRIPPGDNNKRVAASTTFDRDVELLSLMPHMHLRGKDFKFVAHYPKGYFPDKETEVLLDVPTYDFNWQHRYRYETPLFMPRGTKIECIAHFDNSADNEANPDPSKTVRWGDQTYEEMMIGFISYVDAVKPRPDKAARQARNPVGE